MFIPYKKGEKEKEQVEGLKRADPVIEGKKSFFWTPCWHSVFIFGSYFFLWCFLWCVSFCGHLGTAPETFNIKGYSLAHANSFSYASESPLLSVKDACSSSAGHRETVQRRPSKPLFLDPIALRIKKGQRRTGQCNFSYPELVALCSREYIILRAEDGIDLAFKVLLLPSQTLDVCVIHRRCFLHKRPEVSHRFFLKL